MPDIEIDHPGPTEGLLSRQDGGRHRRRELQPGDAALSQEQGKKFVGMRFGQNQLETFPLNYSECPS